MRSIAKKVSVNGSFLPLHVPSPSLSKFIIVPTVTDCLTFKMGSKPVLFIKRSVTIGTMIKIHLHAVTDPAAGYGGARNMKSMRPSSAAIFFMTYFHRAGEGGHCPLAPHGSATTTYHQCHHVLYCLKMGSMQTLWRFLHITLKISKVPSIKTVTLTLRVYKPQL